MTWQSTRAKARRAPKPLDPARLEELALAYVARFSTTRAKLAAYLARKLRERDWDGADEPAIEALCDRFVGAGYVDDAAFARARSGSLLRRGYGERRITEALGAAGIGEDIRSEVRAGERARRQAALVMARKRGFGPFARTGSGAPLERPLREKQVAAMLRAGHALDSARELVDARSVEAAETWAAQGSEEDGCD